MNSIDIMNRDETFLDEKIAFFRSLDFISDTDESNNTVV